MNRLIGINEASKRLGVSISTLRGWEETGVLVAERTPKGHKLHPNFYHNLPIPNRKTVAYARVSSHDQKDDLERQIQVLELYCAKQGWTYEIVGDLGSGMNYHKKGLKQLLEAVKVALE